MSDYDNFYLKKAGNK